MSDEPRHAESGDEKRQSVRLRKYIPLVIEDRLQSAQFRAAVADISETGMRVIADQYFAAGTKYAFSMKGPPNLSLRGEVRWIHDFERQAYQLGIQFIDISEEDDKRLRSFLEMERSRLTMPP